MILRSGSVRAALGAWLFLFSGVSACSSEEPGGPPSQADAGTPIEPKNDAAPSTESGALADDGPAAAKDTGPVGAEGCTIPATEDDQPTLLSKTGCVEPTDPTKVAASLIAYDVSSPLWSDGASKERYVYLPPGKKIHVKDHMGGTPEDEGHWEFPVGTVLVKSFSIGGKRVETRLLMRKDDIDWLGFSYEWNDAGTDATLVSTEFKEKMVGTQTWHYPSRAECLQCHTTEGGRSLGPSTPQMNIDFAYATGMKNQVQAFADKGLFDVPPKMIAAYPKPSDDGDLTARARSYMHVNCAICHRPGGALSDIDLRFTSSF
ncbi:MAG TPA: hypothetical protein VJT73_15915, partial [Polyangiaceae bacterium]|nr:hypothetical protein [Polyangiaceae bacterium]